MKERCYAFFGSTGIYAFYALLFFIPISISFIEVFSTLMLVSFAARQIIRPGLRNLAILPNILLLCFLFLCAVSVFNSGELIRTSVYAFFVKWARYIALCFVLQDTLYDEKVIRRGVVVFLCAALVTVLSGLSQYFFNFEFIYRHPQVSAGDFASITSSFNYRNDFGAFLVVALSMAAAFFLYKQRKGAMFVILYLFLTLSAIAIALTLSRGSWFAVSISLLLIICLGRRKYRMILSLFAIAGILIFIPGIKERAYLTFKVGGDSFRLVYWDSAFNMIKAHPIIGVGLGTFMANYPKYLPGYNITHIAYAHNCFLQIWAESGLFSLVAFLCFLWSLFRAGIKRYLFSRDTVLLGLLAGLLGFLAHSFFDTNLYSLQLAVLFWTWAGLILKISYSPCRTGS